MTFKMAVSIGCTSHLCLSILSACLILKVQSELLPLVLNTWPIPTATETAWSALTRGDTAVNSLVLGCSICEKDEKPCGNSIGYGGSPDESGETTLDAMIMNGATYEVGSVADLRRIKNAIGVAKSVMDYTKHSLIVGDSATSFAINMGFKEESLTSNFSYSQWKEWQNNSCQPNFRKNVAPDPNVNCGPYSPAPDSQAQLLSSETDIGSGNHDTIGMIVIDKAGNTASGTSTNGLTFKIPGRVGDSPIPGAGSYASNLGGAAAATGNGDIMMRFLPSYHAVMLMENGVAPDDAVQLAIARIIQFYPDFRGALIAADTKGEFGAACHGIANFTYCARNPSMSEVIQFTTGCT